MISMRMVMRERLALECPTCGRNEDDHERNCPSDAKRKLLDNAEKWMCPSDRCGGDVMVTAEDLLQCRGCARRYSRGEIADVDPAELALIHKLSPDEDYEMVKVFAKRGVKRRTVFKVDLAVKRLREQEVAWRRRLTDSR